MPTPVSPNAVEVSVIVPVYNSERFIAKCVASLLSSNFDSSRFEVICVDNGSSDNSLGILRSFEPAIRVIVEPRRGPSAARNAGVHHASGEFILFTDSDCMVNTEWLAAMVNTLQQTHAGAVGGRILARPEAGVIDRFGELVHDHQNAIEVCLPPYLITMNLAIRRDLLLSVGGFDERLLRYEDVDLSYRLLAAGEQLVYCDRAVIYHHNRDTLWSLMREGYLHGYFGEAYRKSSEDFVEKYRSAAPSAPRTTSVTVARLNSIQRFLLWRIFRNAKRFGMLLGRLSPPVAVP